MSLDPLCTIKFAEAAVCELSPLAGSASVVSSLTGGSYLSWWHHLAKQLPSQGGSFLFLCNEPSNSGFFYREEDWCSGSCRFLDRVD